ncbi:hypothetical protein BOTBODRAFT_68325 [Botryobasidium botryosum FD-172 SS1]|uniref:Uncharacterized protein n=1 Tax=Botryobasidium botryosum (strain FD-172 SS1) TaxID=930990 RepID=A0A067MHJ9_BOTB1|nr:hypothetical protein BOTBODRAFT_68325 [Botryobasidium botryosum FD-172 SS1]
MMDVCDNTRGVMRNAEKRVAELPSVQQELIPNAEPHQPCAPAGTSLRNLPAGLLSDIFALLARHHGIKPSTLCLVSRAWYDLAIATPRLWCNLDIRFREGNGKKRGMMPIDVANRHVVLSRAAPIDVTIQFAQSSQHSQKDISNLFKSIRPSMSRWRSLSIVENTPYTVEATLRECAAATPSIGVMHLCSAEDPDSVTFAGLPEKRPQPTPKLRELVLRNIYAISIGELLTPSPLPWLPHLTVLTLTDDAYCRGPAMVTYCNEILRVLEGTGHLQYLTLGTPEIRWDTDFWPDSAFITMPSLLDLRICCINATNLLGRIIAPALISLRVREGDPGVYPDSHDSSNVAGFFQQSSPTLRILRFANPNLRVEDPIVWRSVLSAMPALEELYIIESLARLYGDWICPRLRELVWLGAIDSVDTPHPPVDALVDLLTVRNTIESQSTTPVDFPTRIELLGFPAVFLNDEQLGIVRACDVHLVSCVGFEEVVEDPEYLTYARPRCRYTGYLE